MEDMISSRQLMSMCMACSSLCASSTRPIWSRHICLKQLLQGPLAPHCYQTLLLQVQEAVHSPGSHQPNGGEAKASSLHVSCVQGNVGPSAPPISSSYHLLIPGLLSQSAFLLQRNVPFASQSGLLINQSHLHLVLPPAPHLQSPQQKSSPDLLPLCTDA